MTIRPETDIDTFLELDIRAGVVERAEPFPDANKPSLKLWIDFGDDVGTRTSSAQLRRRYSPDELVGTTVLGVVNLPPRRIAGFVSEVLVLGVVDPENGGDVVLVRPDGEDDVRGWRLA